MYDILHRVLLYYTQSTAYSLVHTYNVTLVQYLCNATFFIETLSKSSFIFFLSIFRYYIKRKRRTKYWRLSCVAMEIIST